NSIRPHPDLAPFVQNAGRWVSTYVPAKALPSCLFLHGVLHSFVCPLLPVMSQSLRPIEDIARRLNLPDSYFEPICRHGAKLTLDILSDPAFPRRGQLILVTATTPTPPGQGKTLTPRALTP